jgi:hypothetical protein
VARAGSDRTAPRTSVVAFAVDHHAAGQHEATLESDPLEGRQHAGGADIVVLHVLDDIVESDPQAHFGRLMTDGFHTVQEPGPGPRPTNISAAVLGSGVLERRVPTVDHRHVVA